MQISSSVTGYQIHNLPTMQMPLFPPHHSKLMHALEGLLLADTLMQLGGICTHQGNHEKIGL